MRNFFYPAPLSLSLLFLYEKLASEQGRKKIINFMGAQISMSNLHGIFNIFLFVFNLNEIIGI